MLHIRRQLYGQQDHSTTGQGRNRWDPCAPVMLCWASESSASGMENLLKEETRSHSLIVCVICHYPEKHHGLVTTSWLMENLGRNMFKSGTASVIYSWSQSPVRKWKMKFTTTSSLFKHLYNCSKHCLRPYIGQRGKQRTNSHTIQNGWSPDNMDVKESHGILLQFWAPGCSQDRVISVDMDNTISLQAWASIVVRIFNDDREVSVTRTLPVPLALEPCRFRTVLRWLMLMKSRRNLPSNS